MDWENLIRRTAYWTVPPGLQELARRYLLPQPQRTTIPPGLQAELARNRKFHNIHKGERCFILATGPSIRDQDLTPLHKERCFAVSDFWKHRHYKLISPAYYCIAPFHYPFTEEDDQRMLKELKQHSQNEIFFFGLRDRDLLMRSGFAAIRERVYYLGFSGAHIRPSNVDLTGHLPAPQGVSLMATWVAIYMGFSEIYLVGCDHDNLWRWDGSPHHTPEHFYDGSPTAGYMPFDVDQSLRAHLTLREQYRWANQLALHHNIRIINANPKSYIDIFPKVSLETLFD